jgi:hypothetical protein
MPMKRLVIASVILVASLSAAMSGDQAIDFTQQILDADGVPYTDCIKVDVQNPQKCVDSHPVTLGLLVVSALGAPPERSDNLSAREQTKRGLLGIQLYRAEKVTLTTESVCRTDNCLTVADRDMILKLVEKQGWRTIWVARVCTALDTACGK